jgi:drug/metabolite transporter (DMT)-like permease
VAGIVLAVIGLALVLDLPLFGQSGGVRVDGIGVMWGLIAAMGLASYFLLSGHAAKEPLPPLVLAGGGLVVGGLSFAVLGVTGILPMTFSTRAVELAGATLPWWVAVVELAAIAAATAYIAGIVATRVLGAKLASFVGLSEVMFAVLFAWVLLGELPRPIQLVGGLFILAGVVAVRTEQVRGPEDRSAPLEVELSVEPGCVTREATADDLAVVPDDRVELTRVDVVAAEDH